MKKQNKQEKIKVSEKLAKPLRNLSKTKLEKSKKEGKDFSLQALDSKKKEDKTQQIEALAEKLKQAESDNLYLRAEFANFKKRSLEEKYMALRYEGEKFISSLATEALDDLDRALSASKENKSLEDLQKGLEMIHKKIDKLLSRFGVVVLDPTGKVFDPSYQEALNFIKDSKVPEDYVVETYKKAYKMHDKIIRPAQVIVAKKE
ncbi:MAG: nucleotide exchange factor GrpE [Oligoflexia bacterium]|nr:nucleotide exchange factor GrpE [Oligoflexia bacterium]